MNAKNASPSKGSNSQTTADDTPLTNASELDPIAELRQEYTELVDTLRKQGARQDPALLYRLMIVMYDLGLYEPSPP